MTNKEENNYPAVLSLNSKELIDWCNQRKRQLHLSNAKLSDLSNVPEGTIDRILTGRNLEFRYSTIQPLVNILIGYNDETPKEETNDFYTNTIDGYKLVVENKNHIIDELKISYQRITREKEYLKKTNDEKQLVIENMIEHIHWLEKLIDR